MQNKSLSEEVSGLTDTVRGFEERNQIAIENLLLTLTTKDECHVRETCQNSENITYFYKEFCKNFQRQKYAVIKLN